MALAGLAGGAARAAERHRFLLEHRITLDGHDVEGFSCDSVRFLVDPDDRVLTADLKGVGTAQDKRLVRARIVFLDVDGVEVFAVAGQAKVGPGKEKEVELEGKVDLAAVLRFHVFTVEVTAEPVEKKSGR